MGVFSFPVYAVPYCLSPSSNVRLLDTFLEAFDMLDEYCVKEYGLDVAVVSFDKLGIIMDAEKLLSAGEIIGKEEERYVLLYLLFADMAEKGMLPEIQVFSGLRYDYHSLLAPDTGTLKHSVMYPENKNALKALVRVVTNGTMLFSSPNDSGNLIKDEIFISDGDLGKSFVRQGVKAVFSRTENFAGKDIGVYVFKNLSRGKRCKGAVTFFTNIVIQKSMLGTKGKRETYGISVNDRIYDGIAFGSLKPKDDTYLTYSIDDKLLPHGVSTFRKTTLSGRKKPLLIQDVAFVTGIVGSGFYLINKTLNLVKRSLPLPQRLYYMAHTPEPTANDLIFRFLVPLEDESVKSKTVTDFYTSVTGKSADAGVFKFSVRKADGTETVFLADKSLSKNPAKAARYKRSPFMKLLKISYDDYVTKNHISSLKDIPWDKQVIDTLPAFNQLGYYHLGHYPWYIGLYMPVQKMLREARSFKRTIISFPETLRKKKRRKLMEKKAQQAA